MGLADVKRVLALVFDFDGLILDTERSAYQSWAEIFAEHGCSLDVGTWAACIGTADHTLDPIQLLESQLGHRVDREAVITRRALRRTLLLSTERILPGVEAYLAEALILGLRVGLASSSKREWVAGHLSRLGLIERFDCIRCAVSSQTARPGRSRSLTILPKSSDSRLAARTSSLTSINWSR